MQSHWSWAKCPWVWYSIVFNGWAARLFLNPKRGILDIANLVQLDVGILIDPGGKITIFKAECLSDLHKIVGEEEDQT